MDNNKILVIDDNKDGVSILNKQSIISAIKVIIDENKNLFVGKNYLRMKSDKYIHVKFINNEIYIELDINANFGKNLSLLGEKLQISIIEMIQHITGIKVAQVNVKITNLSIK